MRLDLSENIRKERKERKLTQEQLAEAMNVSVGTVSRWESGESLPDVTVVAELASFFETSVDVLLGYSLGGNNLKRELEGLQTLRNEKKFDEACTMAEKILLRYPNSFDAVFAAAMVYTLGGTELGTKKMLRRALELFERSRELISQNTDDQINDWTIRNSIASLYNALGQKERAVEELKKNNAAGLNSAKIGMLLSTDEKNSEQALDYLSNALIGFVCDLILIVYGYCNAYSSEKKHSDCADIIDWASTALRGLKKEGATSEIDFLEIQMLVLAAITLYDAGDKEMSAEKLRLAYNLARTFDLWPSSTFDNMKFYHCKKSPTAFSDFGATAVGGIEKQIKEQEKDFPHLIDIWKEVCARKD